MFVQVIPSLFHNGSFLDELWLTQFLSTLSPWQCFSFCICNIGQKPVLQSFPTRRSSYLQFSPGFMHNGPLLHELWLPEVLSGNVQHCPHGSVLPLAPAIWSEKLPTSSVHLENTFAVSWFRFYALPNITS